MIIKYTLYSRATKGGGALVKSTSAGGGTVKSTSSGGGTSRSTSSGGGTTATSSSGGGTSRSTNSGGGRVVVSNYSRWPGSGVETYTTADQNFSSHTHLIPTSALGHDHNIDLPSHSHDFSTPNHTHNVKIPSHSHEFTVPSHTHDIDLPNHTHNIDLPDHTHDVAHEIILLDELPSSVTIKVDGNTVPHTAINGDRIDLIPYLQKDSDGKVRRGRHEVTIQPNGLARIEADVIGRVFIQSHFGGKY